MKTHKQELNQSGRLILGSLVIAAALLIAAAGQASPLENELLRSFVTTAVYMLGPLVAAIIVLPAAKHKAWLYITATLMSLAIVIPWSFIDPAAWAQTYLVQLGSSANTLFFMLMVVTTAVECKSTKILWLITAVYLAIMVVLPIV
jgi:hypothetical protein